MASRNYGILPTRWHLTLGSLAETSRITGHVISDSGIPVDLASVSLYREEMYGKQRFTWRELQQASKPYIFDHVAAGSYILVFNENDDRS